MKFLTRSNSKTIDACRLFDKDLPEWFIDGLSNNFIKVNLQSKIAQITSKDSLNLIAHKTPYELTDWFVYDVQSDTYSILSDDVFMRNYIPRKQPSRDRNMHYSKSCFEKANSVKSRVNEVRERVESMEFAFKTDIYESVQNSEVFCNNSTNDLCNVKSNEYDTKTRIILKGTTETLFTMHHDFNITKEKIAILNFASFTNPGGGYIKGSMAQEEELCFNSTLYNVLSRLRNVFYDFNTCRRNSGLYTHDILYSPNIIFRSNLTDQKTVFADVITCAAPNLKIIKRENDDKLLERAEKAMSERIEFILNTAYKKDVEHLIIGPFGCGVFGNDPYKVAARFKSLLSTKYKGVFKSIFISLPIFNDVKNVIAFWDTFQYDDYSNMERKSDNMAMKQKIKKVLTSDQKLDRTISTGDIVKHFKGNLYQIIDIAEHTETGETLVVYKALYPDKAGKFKTYARPYDMFMSKVDTKKYPDVEQEYRMEKIYFADVVNKIK